MSLKTLETEPSVADQMNPEDPNNTLDESGNGTKWDPAAVLAAAEAATQPDEEENDD